MAGSGFQSYQNYTSYSETLLRQELARPGECTRTILRRFSGHPQEGIPPGGQATPGIPEAGERPKAQRLKGGYPCHY